MQDSEPWREKVARIIDPEAWQRTDLGPNEHWFCQTRALAKADAIAALSPAPLPPRKDSGSNVQEMQIGSSDSGADGAPVSEGRPTPRNDALCTPWRDVPSHVAEGPSQVRSADNWLVCETPGDNFARLIAAAPDLLEALQHVTANLSNVAPRVPDPHERFTYGNSIHDARAAIAKATGTPP